MRIGIDTGGTFTDVVVAAQGGLSTFKIPSTPSDPSAAILEALARTAPEAGGEGRRLVLHGSTVATNALLEGKTARAALLTTAGFEDILEIGRQARPALYDLEVLRPRPLVPRELRFAVSERVLASGEVRRPLDAAGVDRAARAAREAGAESLAIAFLHSYLSPGHEEEAGRIAAASFTGPITLSSSLVREFREYERFSTAAANAAVGPVIAAYLDRLARALPPGSLRIMGSNGGVLGASRAAAEAVRTVLSGPAAGVVAARLLAAESGFRDVVTFDMGGTSTDVSLVPGEILLTGETVVAGHPIRTPVIDIHTVGAGGGSVAWVDDGGALKVGPRSAGADPGPACYGRGGPPTVTDAHLLLGRIVPERFLDGKMRLDASASGRAIADLGARLGIGPEETAAGILDVANVTMARALRQVSLHRGHDPAAFTLVAFGGAGGLHAADLAEAAGLAGVLVPPAPGVLSAWGLVAGDLLLARSATVLRPASALPAGSLDGLFRPLRDAALRDMRTETPSEPGAPVLFEESVDARYLGQSHEINVPAGPGWIEAFQEAHRRLYGFVPERQEVVAVTLRLAARQPAPPVPRPSAWAGGASRAAARRQVWDGGRRVEAAVAERSSLEAGSSLAGPAIVTDPGSTLFVPGGWRASVRPGGAIHLGRLP